MRVREIAALLSAGFEGDSERKIRGVGALEEAGPDEVSFVANTKAEKAAQGSSAGCLLVRETFSAQTSAALIRVAEPRDAMAVVIAFLHPPRRPAPGVHRTAVVSPSARIGYNVSIGPHCSIGDDVEIGEGSVVHANVTVYPDTTIGVRAVIHSGTVIGADGFGFVYRDCKFVNFPQIGRVVIGDDVEIGANCCIDRGALGATTIGDGTKLDNMVHVAHNCRIGRHVLIAAQTGLAGGVEIEDYAVIGGQVGIGDKARIESRAVVGSGAGVLTSKVLRGGQTYWGTPARPLREHLQQLAALSQVPKLIAEVKALRKR
jgi:UDP-3-O-[3-hydroxymyristoyl] glucosamine N-acyltransferase